MLMSCNPANKSPDNLQIFKNYPHFSRVSKSLPGSSFAGVPRLVLFKIYVQQLSDLYLIK